MPQVFFSIPLAGRRDEAGWAVSCRLLRGTLASVLNQTDPALEVVLTGHERPDLPELDDPRVTFLEASFAKPADPADYRADKRRKRRRNALHVRERGGGYVVFLDADDLISRRLVRHLRGVDDPDGYVFPHGYVLDHAAGILGRYDDFDRHCGSCAAIRFTPEDLREDGSGYGMAFYDRGIGHPEWRGIAAGAGRPLREVPFPAAVYVVNTSQNLSLSRGQENLNRRLAKIRKRQVPLTAELAAEFSLHGVPPAPARTATLAGRLRALRDRLGA